MDGPLSYLRLARGGLTAVLACVITLTCWSVPARAASLFDLGDRYFESFEELESIGADIIIDIKQDAEGYIWLATQMGLIRYDGYEFRPYIFDESDPSSISGNYIRSLHLAGDEMWVGTYSDGVSVYDANTDSFRRIQHDPADPTSLLDNDIRALVAVDQAVVIASRAGINLYDRNSGEMHTLGVIAGCDEFVSEGKFTALAATSRELLIGSINGLCRIDVRSQSLFQDQLIGTRVEGLNDQKTYNIDLLGAEQAWISTSNNGIAVLDLDSGQIRWITADENDRGKLHHAWVDGVTRVDDEVWAATAGGGIAVIDPASLRVREHITYQPANLSGLLLNDVSAIFVDESGLVWIGTWGGGMNRFNPANGAFKTLKQDPFDAASLRDPDIRAALEMQNGDIWLGGFSTGVQVVRADQGLVRTYRIQPGVPGALQGGSAFVFEQLDSGEIWVATNQSGVYRFNEVNDTFTQFANTPGLTDDNVRSMFSDGSSALWLGTNAGLSRMDLATREFAEIRVAGKTESAFDAAVYAMVRFRGDLWVGTNSGLFVVPAGSQELIEVTSDPAHPISDDFVSDLLVDSRDRLWLATAQGLDILTSWDGRTAVFESVNRKLGIPKRPLGEEMVEDNLGRIWAHENLIDPTGWQYTVVDRRSGWDIGNQWIGSKAKLRDGTILFGGTRGLLMIRPERYQSEPIQSRLTITQAQVDAQPVSASSLSPLVLQPQIRSFSIEFSALDFSKSNERRYEYRLEGYDDNWVSTDYRNRRASYSKLAPGDYLLRVRTDAGDGQWSTRELAVPVTQLPAWYQTYWFRTLLVIGLLGFLYAAYRRRVTKLKRHKRALDLLVEARTENIRQLAMVGQDITASLELDDVLTSVYRHVSGFMDASVFAIGVLDAESGFVNGIFHYQDGERCSEFTRSLADERSPAVWCIVRQKALIVSDVDDPQGPAGEFDLIERNQRVQSYVFFPLVFEEKVTGFISLQSYQKSAYQENELEMLKTIAAYAAVAIDNAKAHKSLNEAKAEIERISLQDQLTGLQNRRFLDKLIPSESNRLQRLVAAGSQERLGLILIDLDRFKALNDTYGHFVGDEVLKQLAAILKASCREMDWAVRLGGEEFLVVARVTSKEQLLLLTERIRLSVCNHRFAVSDELTLQMTCSLGVTQFPFIARTFAAVSWEQTLNLADRALYSAKNGGRNRWFALFENRIEAPFSFYNDALRDLDYLRQDGQVLEYESSDFPLPEEHRSAG